MTNGCPDQFGIRSNDWIKTWEKIEAKYQKNPEYRKLTCDPGKFNIDAKINGAYFLVGMLYGKRDLDETIIISTRCGQDSDCNPSNAAGVLFTTLGFSKLPALVKYQVIGINLRHCGF